MINLTGKVALVTGGSRGIGSATVRTLVAAGADVVLHYGVNQRAAEQTAREAGSQSCHLIAADLAVPGSAKSLWRSAQAWKSRVDILVNNAGVYSPGSVSDSDQTWRKVWQDTLQVNLTATADLCREAIKAWQADGKGGSIVNVASRAAFRGDGPDYWAYAASKGAMIALTKTLARAYSREGIYTYAVAPGFVSTDMALESFEHDSTLRQRTISEIPIGDIAPAEQVANIICFLSSGLASHATGQTVDINGASYVR